jgi:hypothetical protein
LAPSLCDEPKRRRPDSQHADLGQGVVAYSAFGRVAAAVVYVNIDRARVLRALRQVRQDLRAGKCRSAEKALEMAVQAVKTLEIPHLDWEDDSDQVVH